MKRRPPPHTADAVLAMVEEGCPFQPADFPPGTPPEQAARDAHRRWAARHVLDSLRHHLGRTDRRYSTRIR